MLPKSYNAHTGRTQTTTPQDKVDCEQQTMLFLPSDKLNILIKTEPPRAAELHFQAHSVD
jgi:hypothetical protein